MRSPGATRGGRQGLDRVAEGEGVGDRGDALGAFGEQDAVGDRRTFEAGGEAAVLVEDSHIQVRDGLAGRLDQVLHRFEHAGANRAVRDREQAVPVDVARQRVVIRPAGPHERGEARMAFRRDPRLVVDDALVPERRVQPRGQCRVADCSGRQHDGQDVDAAGASDVRGQFPALLAVIKFIYG
jgi:hypothetical protein